MRIRAYQIQCDIDKGIGTVGQFFHGNIVSFDCVEMPFLNDPTFLYSCAVSFKHVGMPYSQLRYKILRIYKKKLIDELSAGGAEVINKNRAMNEDDYTEYTSIMQPPCLMTTNYVVPIYKPPG